MLISQILEVSVVMLLTTFSRPAKAKTIFRGYFRVTKSIWFSTSFGLLDLLSGTISALVLLPMIGETPWVLSIFPILLTVRGAGNGIFSGVLTTSLHIGTIEPRFRKNTEYYYSLVASVATMSIINSFIALLMIIMLFLDALIVTLAYFIMLLTMVLTICFSITTTSIVGFISFRRGINPDDVVYPIMSTLNDVLISLFLLLSILIIRPSDIKYALKVGLAICTIIFCIIGVVAMKFRKHSQFRKTIREGLWGVIYAVVLSSIGGYLLSSLYSILLYVPEFMIILPLLMTITGNAGSIMASRYTTALNIGEVDVKHPEQTIYFIGKTSSLFIAPYTSTSILGAAISIMISRRLSLGHFFWLTIKIFQIGFLSVFLSVPIVIFVSFQTFKYGLRCV